MVPVAIGLAAAITSCGSNSTPSAAGHSVSATTQSTASSSSASTPSASASGIQSASSSSSADVPAGYQRVGGAAQGISVAVPSSWAAVNLAEESVQTAAEKIGLKGFSASTLVQDMQSLQKLHAVFVIDVKSAVDTHYGTNLNAYCSSSGVTDVGSSGVPLLRQSVAAEFQQVKATHISQQDISVGGIPGVETSYELSTSGIGTLDGSQLEVLPKSGRACYVTLTAAAGQFPSQVLPVVASTAQFP